MKKITLLLIVSLFALSFSVRAQTGPGDITFIAYNADDTDDFAIVTLVDISSGTSIWFTDNEWTGSAFNNLNEGEIEWQASSLVPSGTVIVFNSIINSSISVNIGTIISASGFNLGASNEAIFALLEEPATSMPSATFLAGISNDLNGSGATLSGTGLVSGTNFINFGNDHDGFKYTGTRIGEVNFSDYLPLIMNIANWQDEASDGTLILPISTTAFTTSGGTSTVATPTFSPVAGTYYSSQDVTISTATTGATIYYTTDGNDPTTSSTVYSAPITVSVTTTLKAFATKTGETDSDIATSIYTFVTPTPISDLATLRNQATGNDVYQLTGEAFLTYQLSYRNQKYIQDETGAILIDDNSGIITTTYSRGDGITGIIGKLSSYNGMLQFIPQVDPGNATSNGNAIFATIITANEFTTNFEAYEARLVRITNLTFSDGGDTFANGTVYQVTDNNSDIMNFRTNFYNVDYIGTTIPSVEQDIIGLAIQRDNTTGTYFLTARDSNDITNYPRVPLGSTGIVIAVLLITVVIFVRKGRII